MTRLRQPERIVLDTLVDAGVARSRSDALAWAVRLVGEHADEWLDRAAGGMAKVTTCGPRARPATPAPDAAYRARSSRGNSTSQIAMWWHIAASTVAAWKNSW